jgi:hypothetical protein
MPVPAVTTVPGTGAVKAIVGGATDTFTLTAAEVPVNPAESVTRAVNATGPNVFGVQETVYGEEAAAPKLVLPAKYSTCVTTAPALADAVAVRLMGTSTAMLLLFTGVEIDAVGCAVAVILTGNEVAVFPLESVTRAVSTKLPAAVGAQTTEYGAVVSVPMIVVPTTN